MKIIHSVLGKANPERMNGVNKVAHNLATTQTNLGYDVTVWGITHSLEENYPTRNYKTTLFQAIPSKINIHESIRNAIAKLSKDTVFHIHGSFIKEFAHIAKLLTKYNIPYVYTSHGSLGPIAMQQNAFIKKYYFFFIEKYILQNAKMVHLLGKSEVENVKRLMPKTNNTVMIPNGQDLSQIPTVSIDKSQRKNPIFGFLGRLDKNHKGLDLLLDGFAGYMKNGGTGTLELVGNGEDMDFLKNQAARLNISSRLTFHGAKFGDEKFEYLANFDIFVHTSRMEGFPTAVLEAAALGLPCLCSEATNANDYLREWDAGYCYKENKSENITHQLQLAERDFNDKSISRKGRNARKMIESAFTWEVISEALINVYKK
ncbi:MAG: glycosyltransferase involved in cell wall biosynthesis [Saprospiraceae bacterium]|jgi:glycosyltransferase involved in cell wall biosynthesis